MLSYEDIARRIFVFSGQIQAACGMNGWCFDNQRALRVTTSSYENELQSLLKTSGCLDHAYDHFSDKQKPFVLSDRMGLVWIGEFADLTNEASMLFLFGPAFTSHASIKGIESSLQALSLSVSMRSGIVQILHTIPVVPLPTLIHDSIIMHFTMTEQKIRSDDILFQTRQTEKSGTTDTVNMKNLEYYNNEEVRTVEQMLLQLVREGNTNYQKIWEQVVNLDSEATDYGTGNPIREMKDEFLIFTALCSRAAIEGGLPASMAKSLENRYITQIEASETTTDLARIHSEMLEDFIQRVRQTHANPQISHTVHQCFDYVDANLLVDFSLDELAGAVGYTKYYLTKKFSKETGISLNEYIKDRRIEQAKIWLLTTGKSIQEISDSLHFGTRNYFSKVFLEKNDLTPAAYRGKLHGPGQDDP